MITFEPLQPDAVRFLSVRTGGDFSGYDYTLPAFVCATSRTDDGAVTGVLMGEFTSRWEVHMTCAVDDNAIISRRLLHAIFATFFSFAVRVTAMCRPENKRSEASIRRLGFRFEGYSRLGIEGKWDALVFGMLRSECRWIRAPKESRYETAKAA